MLKKIIWEDLFENYMKYTLLLALITAGFTTNASESTRQPLSNVTITGYSNEPQIGIYIGARIEANGCKEEICSQYLFREYHCSRTDLLTHKQTKELDKTKAREILEQLEIIHRAHTKLALLLRPTTVQPEEKTK